jgi:hypothetical protein
MPAMRFLVSLVVQAPEVFLPVLGSGAVIYADPATMDARRAMVNFSVLYTSGRAGDFFGRLNRSFSVFVKTSSTVPA